MDCKSSGCTPNRLKNSLSLEVDAIKRARLLFDVFDAAQVFCWVFAVVVNGHRAQLGFLLDLHHGQNEHVIAVRVAPLDVFPRLSKKACLLARGMKRTLQTPCAKHQKSAHTCSAVDECRVKPFVQFFCESVLV